MHKHKDQLDPDQLKGLDSQIKSAKSRYERFEGMPRPVNAALGYMPPIIGFIGIFPAYGALRLMDWAGYSTEVGFGVGLVVFLAFTSGLALHVRNQMTKNPRSRWGWLQGLY